MSGRAILPKISADFLARAYRDPLSKVSLAVDLLPVFAVLFLGWGATPLVALYWLENLVIGAFTFLRIIGAGVGQGGMKLPRSLFLGLFFCVHYTGFCWGHGIFISQMVELHPYFMSPLQLVSWALQTGPYMGLFLLAIIGVNAAVYARDFIGRGDYLKVDPSREMMAPYGRIVTLHIAIILGASLVWGAQEPLMGVLLLILIRVLFGIGLTLMRRARRDREEGAALGAPVQTRPRP